MSGISSPLKHGVVAVLEDRDGCFLFIRRGLKIQRAPGFWCLVGGEVEPGESHEQAVVREVREEVGLIIEPLEKVHETISPSGDFRLHWLRVRLVSERSALSLHPVEVADARWLKVEQALELDPLLPALRTWLSEKMKTGEARSA